MFNITKDRSIYVFILLIILVIIVGTSFIPLSNQLPNRDSGVFLYMGQQILDGSIPYRDIWDHKGPTIYYVNAFGLLIAQGSQWGVFFLELLSLFIAASFGYIVMSRSFGRAPAVCASILWIFGIFYLFLDEYEGNFTEEYSLPLSFATIYLFLQSRNSNSKLIYFFFIGFIFSISFLFKPNSTGIQFSVLLFIFIEGILQNRIYDLIKRVLSFILGSLLILVPVLFYFKWNDALNDLFDIFLQYNILYSQSGLKDKMVSILQGLFFLAPSGLLFTAFGAWIFGILAIRGGSKLQESQKDLIYLSLLAMPIEFIFSAISGRIYYHYYICWLPVFAVLTSYFFSIILTQVSSTDINVFKYKVGANYVFITALLIAMCSLTSFMIYHNMKEIILSYGKRISVIDKVEEHRDDAEYLLMWGAEASVNYATKIKSPTRYVYQYPLYTCGYYTKEMINEFLDDIRDKKPMIVDTSSTNEFIPPIDDIKREQWANFVFAGNSGVDCQIQQDMGEVFNFINSQYEPVDTIEENGWVIYIPRQ